MKPRDEWTVGDIISFADSLSHYFLIVEMVPNEFGYAHPNVIYLYPRSSDEKFAGIRKSSFTSGDTYHSSLTADQMILLHLKAYKVLHAQLVAQLLPLL